MSKCGKCGAEGHNARSCGKAAAPANTPKRGVKRKAVASGSNTAGSVSEALINRRDQLRVELAKIESVLETIGELGL